LDQKEPSKVLLKIYKNHGLFSSHFCKNLFGEIEAESRQEKYILIELKKDTRTFFPKKLQFNLKNSHLNKNILML
jgi:hypothetical protein